MCQACSSARIICRVGALTLESVAVPAAMAASDDEVTLGGGPCSVSPAAIG